MQIRRKRPAEFGNLLSAGRIEKWDETALSVKVGWKIQLKIGDAVLGVLPFSRTK
jgi:hypothetical protein